MNAAFEVGAAALRAEQRALEIHANNVANVNTPSFKRTEARFAEVLAENIAAPGETGPGQQTGSGIRVVPFEMLFAQGNLRSTGNPLDLAIDGQGFVELAGYGGETVFWRGGTMRVNEDGLLATSDGLALRAGIIVPEDAEALTIAPDGLVTARTSTGENVEIGQIGLVRVEHEGALERLDNGLMRAADGARLIDARPGEDGAGTLVQGSVEESNVELSEEMVRMLMLQRAFAANAQVLQAADQLASITNNLKR
jgi:flagellar basal-body rod protein FlgG